MPVVADSPKTDVAFPKLDEADLKPLRCLATVEDFGDGDVVFRAGVPDVDLFVVESGQIDVLNPTDGDKCIAIHTPGDFSGDIDLLTRRPVVVTGVARGPTRLLRVPGSKLRELLNRVPRLSEKLIVAFQLRRQLLQEAGVAGIRVVGPASCRDTTVVREFLYKNFVPFSYMDTATPEGKRQLEEWGSPRKSPVIQTGDGRRLLNPSLRELASKAGIWRECPTEAVDLAVVGAGPAGMTAAVYAASEGLATIVLDRLGPGGQAGGSSKIENFIGFPAGLSGMDLATRGVLQMLKFGAYMAAPVSVDRLEPAQPSDDPKSPPMHTVHLDCGAKIQARAILVATGVTWRKLEAEGAARFERAGVYYACTTVEATLHDATDVAVVGAGNSAGQAAMFLAECCRNRKVHMIIRRQLGPGMSEYLASRIRATPNIVLHEGQEIATVIGDRKVEAVELKGDVPPGQPTRLPMSAVFVFIGAEPHARWLPESIARDSLGYLLTGQDAVRSGKWPLKDRDPCPLETTMPGVLAAGDIRSGSTKRVGFAVGDGALAVTCAHKLRSLIQ